ANTFGTSARRPPTESNPAILARAGFASKMVPSKAVRKIPSEDRSNHSKAIQLTRHRSGRARPRAGTPSGPPLGRPPFPTGAPRVVAPSPILHTHVRPVGHRYQPSPASTA